jgi:hypothetical protein
MRMGEDVDHFHGLMSRRVLAKARLDALREGADRRGTRRPSTPRVGSHHLPDTRIDSMESRARADKTSLPSDVARRGPRHRPTRCLFCFNVHSMHAHVYPRLVPSLHSYRKPWRE